MDRNLLAFIAVAETGNVSSAAEQLHVTQPTLTKRLQQLEQHYATPLLQRTSHGMRLTTAGEALLERARAIQVAYLQAEESVALQKSGMLKTLRIGAGPLFHIHYLGSILAQIQPEFPGTQLRMIGEINDVSLPMLRSGELDMVFGTYETVNASDQIRFIPFEQIEHGVILHEEDTRNARDRLPLAELSDRPWIVYGQSEESGSRVFAAFDACGAPKPTIALYTTSFALAFEMARHGPFVISAPIQLAPAINLSSSGCRLRTYVTNPSIANLPGGAYVRESLREYPIVKRILELCRSKSSTS
ncbi:LysR family transcriptional regulator [Granulosicoccus sp. 3-233]|uniref:LysR family transcriptional regulator n=1 Tax=Granulosicoccus sp. 3-233 TaxID=3417969 RepID=UPI003D326929